MTTEKLTMGAIERGLTLKDFEEMTIGMIIDYVITYNNAHLNEEDENEEVRLATQADFDRW